MKIFSVLFCKGFCCWFGIVKSFVLILSFITTLPVHAHGSSIANWNSPGSISDISKFIGESINATLPSFSGAGTKVYFISGNLPNGISFNAGTRKLTGTVGSAAYTSGNQTTYSLQYKAKITGAAFSEGVHYHSLSFKIHVKPTPPLFSDSINAHYPAYLRLNKKTDGSFGGIQDYSLPAPISGSGPFNYSVTQQVRNQLADYGIEFVEGQTNARKLIGAPHYYTGTGTPAYGGIKFFYTATSTSSNLSANKFVDIRICEDAPYSADKNPCSPTSDNPTYKILPYTAPVFSSNISDQNATARIDKTISHPFASGGTGSNPSHNYSLHGTSVSSAGIPIGMSFDANTAILSGIPTDDAIGIWNMTYIATDNTSGDEMSQNYTLNISANTTYPNAKVSPDQTAIVGTEITLSSTGSTAGVASGVGNISYNWEQTDSTGIQINISSNTDSNIIIIAPNVSENTTFFFTLTITNELGNKDTAIVAVTVIGAYSSVDFVTTWQTTTSGETLTIATNSAAIYNYAVDCDYDGINDLIGQTEDAICTYPTAGIHTMIISGTFPRIYFNNEGDKDKIISIEQWGSGWTTMDGAFAGAINLVNKASDIPIFAAGAAPSFASMFSSASKIDESSKGNWAWNTTSVKNMSSAFFLAVNFNQNLGNWNMSQVTNVADMLSNSGLSTENYDATLIGWAGQNLKHNLSLGANALTYSPAGKVARDKITASVADVGGGGGGGYNWTIDGDELAFNLDVDGDGIVSAATDGVLINRFMLNPAAIILDTRSVATSTSANTILSVLNAGKQDLDIDGDGALFAATDGVLILKYMLDPAATFDITDAVGDGSSRNTAEAIKTYLQSITP